MANPNSSAQRSFAAEPYDSVAAVLASKQITAALVGKRVHTKAEIGFDITDAPNPHRVHPISGVGLNVVRGERGYNAKALGLRGDGSNEAVEIKRIAELGLDVIHIPNGVYSASTVVEISALNVKIVCDPFVRFDFSAMPASATLGEKYAFKFSGQKGTAVALTADTAKGARAIQIASTSGFAKGDMVEVRSDAPFTPGAVSGVSSTRGWISRVSAVTSGAVILEAGAYEALTVADNATIAKITPVHVDIDGIEAVGGGSGRGHGGIQITYGYKPKVRRPVVRGCENIGVSFKGCYRPRVEEYDVEDCTSTPALGNSGYGVAFLDGTVHGLAVDGFAANCRHSVSGGGSLPTYHCKIVRQTSVNCGISTRDLDCHEPCFFWVFDHCTSEAGETGNGGFVIRGQFCKAVNCRVLNAVAGAYHLRYYGVNTVGQRGNEICGCFSDGSRYAVHVDGQPDCKIKDARIVGLMAFNSGLAGIYANYYDGLEITGGVIDGVTIGSGNDGSCIRLFASVAGASKGAKITGVDMSNPFNLKPCIRMDTVEDTAISGGSMANATAGGIIGLGCKLSSVDGVNVNLAGALWQGSSEDTAITDNVGTITTTGTTDAINMTSGTSLTGLIVTGNILKGSYDRFLETSGIDKIIAANNYAPGSRSSATPIQTTGATTVTNTPNILA